MQGGHPLLEVRGQASARVELPHSQTPKLPVDVSSALEGKATELSAPRRRVRMTMSSSQTS